jgi:hypothetical protein
MLNIFRQNMTASEALTDWFEAVKSAKANANENLEDWGIVGHAGMIRHRSDNLALDLVKDKAEQFELTMLIWNDQDYAAICKSAPDILYVDNTTKTYPPHEDDDLMKDCQHILDSALLALLTELTDHNNHADTIHRIVIVLIVDDFETVDQSICCLGRFDRYFDFTDQSLNDEGQAFLENIGSSICDQSLMNSRKKLAFFLKRNVSDDNKKSLIIAALRRLHARENRLIDYADLIYFALKGTTFVNPIELSKKKQHRVAVHEAGHAAIMLLASTGKTIPDYATVGTNNNFMGVVAGSFDGQIEGYYDQQSVLQHVRICLGGRAAEEVVFGQLGIDINSNKRDLKEASRAILNGFLSSGLQSDFDDPDTTDDHLSVPLEKPLPHQVERAERYSREFIKKQYRVVLQYIRDNRALHLEITQQLIDKKILTHFDFQEIWFRHVATNHTSK